MSNWVDGELLTKKVKLARRKEHWKIKSTIFHILRLNCPIMHPCKQLLIFFLGSGWHQGWILRFTIFCIDGLESYSHLTWGWRKKRGPGLSPVSRCCWGGKIRRASFPGRYVQTGGNTWFWTRKDDKVFRFCLSFGHVTWHVGSLVPQPETEPISPALGTWSLNHWTAQEVPRMTRFLTGREVGGKGSIKRRSISIRGSRVKYHPYSCSTVMRRQACILSSFVRLRK